MKAKNDNEDVGDTLPKWYTDELYKLTNSGAKGTSLYRLSGLNEQKRYITGYHSLSAKEKPQKLRDIQSQINEIYWI